MRARYFPGEATITFRWPHRCSQRFRSRLLRRDTAVADRASRRSFSDSSHRTSLVVARAGACASRAERNHSSCFGHRLGRDRSPCGVGISGINLFLALGPALVRSVFQNSQELLDTDKSRHGTHHSLPHWRMYRTRRTQSHDSLCDADGHTRRRVPRRRRPMGSRRSSQSHGFPSRVYSFFDWSSRRFLHRARFGLRLSSLARKSGKNSSARAAMGAAIRFWDSRRSQPHLARLHQ